MLHFARIIPLFSVCILVIFTLLYRLYCNIPIIPGNTWGGVWPMDMGCRDFVVSSTTRLLKQMEIRGQVQWRAIKDLAAAAERSSQ